MGHTYTSLVIKYHCNSSVVRGKAEGGKLLQVEQLWEENRHLLCPQFLEIWMDKACDWGQFKAFEHPMPRVLSVC